jgi:hypothetical protein
MYRGVGGTYTFQTNVPLLGDVQANVPMDAMMAEAYQSAKKEMYKDLPLLAAGAFALVVAGVVIGNLLVGERR